MHDTTVHIASAVLFSGVLLWVAFLFYSAWNPRSARATTPAPESVSRPKDYGLLAPVARPLEWTIREVEARLTHSWGWAIVATTFLLNALLFPFKLLAARSAARMKPAPGLALAPFVILAAFYPVLTSVAQLHGAPWLWIADLTRPEQLPLRILPILMIATQWWMGRAAPAIDPKMARLNALMPLFFGIVMYGQPSALMLYWVTGNLLQLVQQAWLTRRYALREAGKTS